MKVWLTIEPNPEEIDDLLNPKEEEGVSKTPLRAMIHHAYCIMMLGNEVSLKVTTLKRDYT